MTEIVLVDDAAEILIGLTRIIENLQLDFTVSRTFLNGYDAMESCSAQPPDIIITDIRLPGMSGLELAARLGPQLHRTVILALSAYDEFDYVRSAMVSGVFRYLLKPVSADDMAQALLAAREELKRRDGAIRTETDRNNFRVYNCLYELINHVVLRCPIPECPELCENGQPAAFRLAVVEREAQEDKFFCDEEMPRMYSVQIPRYEIAVLVGSTFDIESFFKVLRPKLERVGRRGCISPKFDSLRYLYRACTETTAFFETERMLSPDVLLTIRTAWYNNCPEQLRSQWDSFTALLEQVKTAFSQDNYPSCVQYLQEAEQALCAMSCCPPAAEIRQTYAKTVSDIAGYRHNLYGFAPQENEAFSTALEQISTAPLLSNLTQTLQTLFVTLFNQNRGHSGNVARTVNMAKTYIALNYYKPITTVDIARAVYISQSYLGALFRQKTGMKLWNYVTLIRLEAAYKYLTTSDLPVNQISGMVGFSNINTFYYAFKKHYGFAPGQFRQTDKGETPDSHDS